MFVDFFIRRPVFATVCALMIILAGAISIPTLPVAQFPNLAPPQVVVTSAYIGANAQTVESAVTIPLEQAINGVPGMKYITSTSSNSGVSTITVTFDVTRDVDLASVDVQNRVSQALGRLPDEVKNTGVIITKQASGFVFGAGVYAEHGEYDSLFLSNYIDVYVRDALKRVPGVNDAFIFGERKYAMRIWLDPARMAQRGLTASNVIAALQEQNVQVAAGQIGQPPNAGDQEFQISVRAIGRLTTPQEFDNIILKTGTDGTLVRLKDVGRSELGAENYDVRVRFNGHDAVGFGVTQLPGANALDVDRAAKAELEKLSKTFPPGLKYAVAFDSTTVIGESIRDVLITLARSDHPGHCGNLSVFAGLAKHADSSGYDSRFTSRHIRFHQAAWVFDQYADPFRNHAGHGIGGRRRDRGDRKRRAAHHGRNHGAAQCGVGGHERSGWGGDCHFARARGGVRAGGAVSRNDGNFVPAIRADDCVFSFDIGI